MDLGNEVSIWKHWKIIMTCHPQQVSIPHRYDITVNNNSHLHRTQLQHIHRQPIQITHTSSQQWSHPIALPSSQQHSHPIANIIATPLTFFFFFWHDRTPILHQQTQIAHTSDRTPILHQQTQIAHTSQLIIANLNATTSPSVLISHTSHTTDLTYQFAKTHDNRDDSRLDRRCAAQHIAPCFRALASIVFEIPSKPL